MCPLQTLISKYPASVLPSVCKCLSSLSMLPRPRSRYTLHQALFSDTGTLLLIVENGHVKDSWSLMLRGIKTNRRLFSHWGKAPTASGNNKTPPVNPTSLVFTDLTSRGCVSLGSLSPCKDQTYCLLFSLLNRSLLNKTTHWIKI